MIAWILQPFAEQLSQNIFLNSTNSGKVALSSFQGRNRRKLVVWRPCVLEFLLPVIVLPEVRLGSVFVGQEGQTSYKLQVGLLPTVWQHSRKTKVLSYRCSACQVFFWWSGKRLKQATQFHLYFLVSTMFEKGEGVSWEPTTIHNWNTHLWSQIVFLHVELINQQND